MPDTENSFVCRKCGAGNPDTNEYCVGCGAMLKVSTMAMEAQPRAVVPVIRRFSVRWMLLGVPVMLGMGAVAAGIGVLLGVLATGVTGGGSLRGMATHFLLTLGALVAVFFAAGGAMMSRFSGEARVAEAAIGAVLSALLMGLAAMSLGADLLVAALVLSVPGALVAGIGAVFGAKRRRV